MFMTNRPVMCSHQPSFQERCNLMHPWHHFGRLLPAMGNLNDHAAIAIHASVSLPIVCQKYASRFYRFSNKGVDAFGASIYYPAHPNPSSPLTIFLRSHNNHCFVNHTASMTPRLWRTDKRFINFNFSPESFSSRCNHGTAQFVQPSPRRNIAAQPQNSLDRQGTGSGFLAGHSPDGPKPQDQGLTAILKNRASRDRSLIVALPANHQSSLCQAEGSVCTARTDKTIWPSQGQDIFATSLIGRKTAFKFNLVSRIILHASTHYMLGAVESIK